MQASITSERGAVQEPLGPPPVLQEPHRRKILGNFQLGRDQKWEWSKEELSAPSWGAAAIGLQLHKSMQGKVQGHTNTPALQQSSLLGGCLISWSQVWKPCPGLALIYHLNLGFRAEFLL